MRHKIAWAIIRQYDNIIGVRWEYTLDRKYILCGLNCIENHKYIEIYHEAYIITNVIGENMNTPPIETFWISLKDELPPKGQNVDIWHETKGRIANCSLYLVPSGGNPPSWIHTPFWENVPEHAKKIYKGSKEITHWMRIPNKPISKRST